MSAGVWIVAGIAALVVLLAVVVGLLALIAFVESWKV
jgi:hypothetical protein